MTALGLALSPKYVARSKLTLLPTRSELGFASMRPEMWGLSPAAFLGQTHQEAMLSRTLAEDVARTLEAENAEDLHNGSAMGHIRRWLVEPVAGSFHRVVTLLNTGRWKSPDPFMSLVDTIRARTKVQNLPGSFVFQVSVTWEKPALAAKIVNLLTERYVQMVLRTSQAEMLAIREYLDAQIKELENTLADLQGKIKEYRTSEKFYSLAYNTSTDLDLALRELSDALRMLAGVRADRQQLEARVDALKAYQTPAGLAALEAERQGLRARQEAIEKIIDDRMTKLNALPAKEAGLFDLYRERAFTERALAGLQDRLLETKVAEAAQLSTVRVIDRAIPPLYPERPLLLKNAAISLLVGLLVSLGLVLAVEAWRPGLRSREDLGSAAVALIGLVPYVAAGHESADARSDNQMAELVRRILRGACGTLAHRRIAKRHLGHLLIRLSEDDRARSYMFISLNGGEGKTFLITQLARLAKEAGRRILIVDANLNRPALHVAFDRQSRAGLAEVLLGKARLGDVVERIDEHVDFIGAGVQRVNGQARWELLSCKEQLNSIAGSYDLVLLDSVALRQDPAVARLLKLCDRAVCVFDATASTRHDLDSVREYLHGSAENVDIVLNKVLSRADHLFGSGGGEEQG